MINDFDKLLNLALQLDGADKDLTSNAIIGAKQQCTATFITKLQGIACGMEFVERIYNIINPKIEVTILKDEGSYLNRGDAIVSLKGRMIDILRASRVCASILDTMGSIAFAGSKYIDEIKGNNCKIVTNYKTIPLFEPFSKIALESIGIEQANYNLQEYSYINESHILTIGSVGESIKAVQKKNPNLTIEVEVINKEEAINAIELKANRILLLDMNEEEIDEILNMDHGDSLIGISNVSIGRVREYAKKGFDYIVIDDLALNIKPMGIYLKVYKRTLK